MSNLKCSKCERIGLVFVSCLASNPPQYEAECRCGFALRWFKRNDSFAQITQEELNATAEQEKSQPHIAQHAQAKTL